MKTKQIRIPELTHKKVKLIAAATGFTINDIYSEAIEAHISKLKAENPLYSVLLHGTDFMVEDNGAEATQDMFTEYGSVDGFSEQPKL